MIPNQQLLDVEEQVSMVIVSKENYNEQRINLARNMAKNYRKICYITINKPYATIVKEFKKVDIDINKFIFIDATPGDHRKTAPAGRCVFIDLPGNLTQISIEFSQLLNQTKFGNSILDSINALAIYVEWKTLIKFVHEIISRVRTTGIKIVFIISSEEESSEITKDLYMFVDRIIKLVS